MPIVGENFGQSFLSHRLHGNAIDQAVALVRPGTKELQTREKDSRLCGITRMAELAKMPSTLSAASRRRGSGASAKNVRYSVNTSSVVTMREAANSAVRVQSLLMGAISEIRQRDAVERVGEKCGHAYLLGRP